MGSQNCNRDPEIILQEALEAGITAFQYREKGAGALTGEAKIKLGERLRRLCSDYSIPFFVNDDVELVSKLAADGIHVGQDDVSVNELRTRFPDLLIGLSISNNDELKQSPVELVDYVGAGPVYSTHTKEDAKQAVGLPWITHLREHYPDLPIVGIGGINSTNAKQVLTAGADGVAVISAISKSTNIAQTIRAL